MTAFQNANGASSVFSDAGYGQQASGGKQAEKQALGALECSNDIKLIRG